MCKHMHLMTRDYNTTRHMMSTLPTYDSWVEGLKQAVAANALATSLWWWIQHMSISGPYSSNHDNVVSTVPAAVLVHYKKKLWTFPESYTANSGPIRDWIKGGQ